MTTPTDRSVTPLVVTVLAGYALLAYAAVAPTLNLAGALLGLVLALAVLGVQVGYVSRPGVGHAREGAAVALLALACLVYVPVLAIGVGWIGFAGFLAGSLLILLPPRVGLVGLAVVVVSVGLIAGLVAGAPLRTIVTAAVSTLVTGLVVHGLTRWWQAADPARPARPVPAALPAGPGESAPGESAPGESAPGESAPGESAPGESAPGESAPAESAPAESAPTESAAAEATPVAATPEAVEPEPGDESGDDGTAGDEPGDDGAAGSEPDGGPADGGTDGGGTDGGGTDGGGEDGGVPDPWIDALRTARSDLDAAGVDLTVLGADVELPDEVAAPFAELLRVAVAHTTRSPAATTCRVSVVRRPTEARIVVTHDGATDDPEPEDFEALGERFEDRDGSVLAERDDTEFTVDGRLPLSA